MKIRRYLLSDNCGIEMPKNARLLHVHLQTGRPCIWALVNEENPEMEIRLFRIKDIDSPFFENEYIKDYVGSIHINAKGFCTVRHVFEVID